MKRNFQRATVGECGDHTYTFCEGPLMSFEIRQAG